MAELRQWPGLISDADPHDIPEGAAQEVENFSCDVPGKLKVRGGLQPITYSPAITAVKDILAMYGWRAIAESRAIYLDTDGDVWDGGGSSTAYETSVSITKIPCWAETRQGNLIRINGAARGTIYDGTNLWPLGITAPAGAPTIGLDSGGAATAGDYVCAYRYKDSNGDYSSLSASTTVTATANQEFNWSDVLTTAEARVPATVSKELYRSTSGQSTTLYLVATISKATTTHTDQLSDDTLAANTALPVLNPDNSLNARRQVPPPTNYEICVPFQDRMFYARPATMTAANRNKILYSEVDEPESVPSTQNVVIVQENTGDNDRVTALIPHGSTLWIAKDRHIYRGNFVRQPNIDMIPTLAHSRGCINQRCWDFYGDVAFVMDRSGPWAMNRAGKQDIGDAVRNYFRENTIDFSKSAWFFVRVEPNEAIVRFYVCLSGQSGSQPKTALCYAIRTQAWTVERYPHGLGGGCRVETSNAIRCLVGGEDGKSLLVNEGVCDVVTTAVTGTATAGAAATLTDSGASFAASAVGASLIITGGTGAGQMRTISARTSTKLTVSSNWTTNPDATSAYAVGGIHAFYKTGIFDIPYDKDGQRVLALTYPPTTNAQYAELEVYYDHNTSAETMKASEQHPEGFDSTAGSTRLRRNLKGARSVLGTAPGFAMHELTMRAEARAITHRYVAAKLTAYQATEALTLYGLEVAGV